MLVVKPTKIGLGPPPPSGIRQTKISPEPTKVKKKPSRTAPDNWTKKNISTSKDYLKAFKHSTCLFKWNVRLWINTRILYRRLSLKKKINIGLNCSSIKKPAPPQKKYNPLHKKRECGYTGYIYAKLLNRTALSRPNSNLFVVWFQNKMLSPVLIIFSHLHSGEEEMDQ